MDRITPTGYANQRYKFARQLGSTAAVLEALPRSGGLFICSCNAERARILDALHAAGRRPGTVRIITAEQAGWDDEMLRYPRTTVVGVDVAAFDALMPSQWAAAYKHLERFQKVHWG